MTALKAELYLGLWVVLVVAGLYIMARLTEPMMDIGVILK